MVVGPAVLMGLTAASAAAAPPGVDPDLVPFTPVLRRCDFSAMQFVSAAGDARPTAHIRNASGQVTADVQLVLAKPNSFYEVKLIQVPRPSSAPCEAGSEGTAVGAIHTDGVGAGTITLTSPLRAGATGAWISIERPQQFSQVPDEFYTSDLITDI